MITEEIQMSDIMVSVYCLAFNHERYIRNALEGFVHQDTNFKYEVFVHDDASTDKTAEIIRHYATKYPDIIKPIYQKENQYSKGISISREIIFPKMKGKYVAICEGDDYWCDNNKLQKQVDFLENNEEYSACVHNTEQINCRNGEKSYINDSKIDMDLQFEKVVERGNSQFQLSSLVCRKDLFLIPSEITAKGFSDYPLAIYLMFKGKIRYFKEVMSVYRLFSEGSWTSQHNMNVELSKQIMTQENLVDFLRNLFKYSQLHYIRQEYVDEIEKVLRTQEVELLMIKNDGKQILKKYKDVYDEFSLIEKIKVRFPLLRSLIRKVKKTGKCKNG